MSEMLNGNDWVNTQFKKLMAMSYVAINVCDFVLFPIMYTVVQFWEQEAANDAFRQWIPLTLSNGGFIHLAYGAILGISSWKKGDENIAKAKQPEGAGA